MPYDDEGNYYESPQDVPMFDEDQDLNSGMETHHEYDLPAFYRTGDKLNDRLRAKQWEIGRQAVLKGDLSEAQFKEMIGGPSVMPTKNFVEKIYGLNAHGTEHNILQPLVDFFSPALYASASWADARAEAIARETHKMRQASGKPSEWNEDVLPWHDSTRWNPFAFSGTDFKKSYQNRTMFGDVFDVDYDLVGKDATAAAWGVLALDVMLDPITWTGIGMVGKVLRVGGLSDDAAKVITKAGSAAEQPARTAARTITEAAGRGTVDSMDDIAAGLSSTGGRVMKTTAWGELMYNATVNKVFRHNMDELADAASVGDEAGEVASPWISQLSKQLVETDAPRAMVEMYDEIAPEVWRQSRGRLMKMFRGSVEKTHEVMNNMFFGGKANSLDLFNPPSASAMFRETAPFWRKEMGLTTFGLAGWTGSKAVGAAANHVDWNWVQIANMDPTAKIAYQTIRDGAKASAVEWERSIKSAFKGYSKGERETITEILEAQGQGQARNTQQIHARQYDPKLVKAAQQARLIFDDIAEEEMKYNLLNTTLNGYVTHMFNGNIAKADNYKNVLRTRGQDLVAEWDQKLNPFSLHRRIASIDELKAVFGKDAVLTDIAEILHRRKRMSLELIAQKKWLLEIQTTQGFGGRLIESAKAGVPKAISRMMVNRQSTPYELSDLTQYWVREEIDLAKWGFRQGDDNANKHLLRWLTSDQATRGSAKEWMRVRGVRGFAGTDKASNFTNRVNPIMGVTSGKVKRTVDINDYLQAVNDAHKLHGKVGATQTPAMVDVANSLGHRKFSDIGVGQHKKILTRFDTRLRREVGPLSQVMPNLNNIFSGVGKVRSKWSRSIPGGTPKPLDELLKELNKVDKVKMVPGLSDSFIVRAKEYRKALGDHTDTVAPAKQVLDLVRTRLKGFGMRPEQTKELVEVLFDKSSIGALSAREADHLDLFLGLNKLDHTSALKAGEKQALIDRYAAVIGEELVEVSIPKITGLRPTLIETNASSILPNVEKRIAGQEVYRNAVDTAHAVNDGVIKALVSKQRELKELRRLEKEAKGRLGRISKADQKTAWLQAEDRLRKATKSKMDFLAKHGNENALKSKLEKVKAKSKLSGAAKNKSRALLKHQRNVRSWVNAEDAALRQPGDKGLRKTADKLKKKVRDGEAKYGLNKAVAPVPSQKKVPSKLVPDPRSGFGPQPAFERPLTNEAGEIINVARDPGTVGPQITAAGETLANYQYANYYLPKSTAALIDDINTQMYSGSFGGHKLGRLLKGYDYATAYFKSRVMAMFGEFHKRNATTDIGLASLKAGLGLLEQGHFNDYSKLLTYGLTKETVELGHTQLIKNVATSGGVLGAEAGAVAGGFAGALDEEGSVLGGALTGAAIGLGAGVPAGAVFGDVLAGAHQVAKGHRKFITDVGKKVGYKADATPLAQQTIKIGDGQVYTVEEFYEEMAKRGVFNTQVSAELFDETGSLLHAMAESRGMKVGKGALASINKKQAIFMQDAFRAGELATTIPIRMMLFTQAAKQTGNLHAASQVVKKYLYDYSNLTMFERRVLRRAIPFYTWTKHALGANWDAIKNHPARFGQQIRPFTSMAKDDGVDPADSPDWLSNRLSRMQVTFDPKTGEKRVVAKQGYGLVQEELIGVWKDLSHLSTVADPLLERKPGDMPGRILSRGPFGVTSGIEYLANFDTFRQGAILSGKGVRSAYESGGEWDNAPPWAQRAVGYEKDERTGKSKVDPRFSWMLGEVAQSRVFSMMKRVYDLDEDGRRRLNYLSLARSVLGEKVYTYGPDNRLYEDRAKIERTAQWLNMLGITKPMSVALPSDEYKKSKKKKSSTYY